MQRLHQILQNRDLFYVEAGQTVLEVTRRMTEFRVGAILVLEGGELRGIFSERDLMTRVVVPGLDPARIHVGDVMTQNPTTIDENATCQDAVAQMQVHGCRHLPVLRTGEVVGLISMRDLTAVELEARDEEIHHMRAYISGAA
jgi:CBS domain-containing protein